MKQFTLLEQLQDEEQYLLKRLSVVRSRLSQIKNGAACADGVHVTVAVSSQSVSVSGVKPAGVGR